MVHYTSTPSHYTLHHPTPPHPTTPHHTLHHPYPTSTTSTPSPSFTTTIISPPPPSRYRLHANIAIPKTDQARAVGQCARVTITTLWMNANNTRKRISQFTSLLLYLLNTDKFYNKTVYVQLIELYYLSHLCV